MKNLIKYFTMGCFAAGTLLCTSCEDFLDRQEDENLTFDEIWLSRNYVRQYWLNCMSFLPNFDGSFIGDSDPYLGASDECTITYDRAYRYINFGTWNASTVPYYKMDSYYQGIRECNIFMQNVYNCTDPDVTKAELDKWYWQARFARAYYYFLMMCDYGPVFLVGDELLDFTASTEELYRPRNTWEQCVDYVVSEMTECDKADAVQRQYGETEYGLATKGTCRAVISRLLLYSARDLFNGNTLYRDLRNPETPDFPEQSGQNLFPQTYEANKWLKAADAAKAVMDLDIYSLYRAGNDNPYEDYYGITNVTWNSELIWTNRYNNRYYWGINTVPAGVSGYGGVGPTQQQVDAYAMKTGIYPITGYESDGTPIADPASGYNVAAELELSTWNYPSSGWSLIGNYNVTAPNMYKDREPRFYVTVFFGGNYWLAGSSSYGPISFASGGNGNQSHDYPKSGYLVNRFYDHTLNSTQGNWGNITFPVFRLGEIYLNFIESVLECKNRGVALPSDYEDLAMEVWADLRDRAGLDPITDVYPNASTAQLIDLCRKERRVELAFERHRYFDTRTWMIAPETDGGPMYGMNTNATAGGSTNTPEEFWQRTVFETRVFNNNHYLYPFSQRELDRNRLLVQNYGW
ncbi:RagB/SusD family nutrient uptake outer membrane protein [Bacteroides gallinaceum]|uniref:RagB/SusD family nutrient uptake outer membrane protein n=1 Tax=Bacteroides gallinaceum TaxID=1462571 RepID=UPI0025A48F27|nr:RagB/SusD family nutrient uptake outer membrane protein [Bacteroides gallinaceum]MDM8207548.1 RagB/SusD family nutrient uptake outer membrane protein [Bacteroides gallinaceum]